LTVAYGIGGALVAALAAATQVAKTTTFAKGKVTTNRRRKIPSAGSFRPLRAKF
jgi:hypothetical protein